MANHLTTRSIEALRPGVVAREIPDGMIGGLYLVLQTTGAKSWAVRYRAAGKGVKMTLGSYPAIDLKAARMLAGEAAVARARGVDPAEAKRTAKRASAPTLDTFETVAAEYVLKYAQRHTRERSWRETERLLTQVATAWRGRRLRDISRADVGRLLDGIIARGAPVIANRTLSALRHLGGWAVERGLVESSPFATIRKPSPETARERVLTAPEIGAAWRAFTVDGSVIANAAQVLLLTGARLREVSEMTWDEIDFGARTWTLPAGRAKNGSAHEVPISDAFLSILAARKAASAPKCRFVFSANNRTPVAGVSKAKKRFDRAMAAEIGEPVTPWRIHDLRRSVATNLAAIGVLPHVVEAVLNHRGGTIAGIARVYNRHPYAAEKRAALDAWAAELVRITAGAVEADAEPMARAA
jgi:integrase